jgi:pyrroline-5-carboxylate reductase
MNGIIGIIGLGNMGKAIFDGLRAKGIECLTSNGENNVGVAKSDTIILCVKPQILSNVVFEIKNYVHEGAVVISTAAGVKLSDIEIIQKHRLYQDAGVTAHRTSSVPIR